MSSATLERLPIADWTAIARRLGPDFAARAPGADADDRFVADNYPALKAAGVISAGVPTELGGGGASHAELAAMLREIATHCASTALALSMHTHQVAIAAWRWRHQKAPMEKLLQRIAAENIVLVSSGGSDWLPGSGTATRVEGGFRIDARKIFASGAPVGDLLLTSAVHAGGENGPEVLHFAVPLKAEGVKILDTWRTLGMRGTGSHDIEIKGSSCPTRRSAAAVRRASGTRSSTSSR
jgi:acyl-CoA dehydrogenase